MVCFVCARVTEQRSSLILFFFSSFFFLLLIVLSTASIDKNKKKTQTQQAVNQNVADLAGRARKGKLAPEEYNGGSFTISNLGMYGISEFTAVINPPQACILAVGGGSPRASVGTSGNDLEKETIMNVTLSADRRVVDDHIAAQYLQVFRTYCEQPSLMAV